MPLLAYNLVYFYADSQFIEHYKLKRFILLMAMACILSVSTQGVFAFNLSESEQQQANQKVHRYIKFVYEKIKFPKHGKLSYDAFKAGYYGYLNLIESGKITRDALLTICDFTMSSNNKRMWVIDVKSKKVVFHTLVAHGQGTGEEFATRFSNIHESHQSSLGFYVTAETYSGNNGYSLKLHGIDGIYNNNAYDRAIVIHGADYVSEEFAKANQRLGRSHGCPALSNEVAPKVIDKIKNGHCLFIYHTSQNYLKNSYWLSSKVTSLPKEADMMDLNIKTTNPRYIEVNEEPDLASVSKPAVPKTYENIKPNTPNEKDLVEEPKSHQAIEPKISKGDLANYKVEVQTIVLKEGSKKPATNDKKVSSIVIINEGSKDTIKVK